jgi:hypothetical protein
METLLLIVTIACVLTTVLTSVVAWTRLREAHERTAVRAEALRAQAFPDHTPAMFGSAAERGTPARRWMAVAAVAAVMTSIAGTAFALHVPRGETARLPESSLELLTLRETADRDGAFVIIGQVRNTSDDQLPGLVTSVDLSDRNSQFIAGKKTPLPVLGAREELAFTVAVPKAAAVARYRVQFRRDDGSVVPHIDHRARNAANGSERTGHEHPE